ncbi:CPBP family intramembrane glutamic endopeptidase [Methanobrevibacter sp. YE315]|uniref:CPBP family intramembrane glutamic endopeptidase n=1 Tax=Methanobrevibacter sp. YE315 TaxID=1609968 RepID=UPI0009E72D42|nr:type II CAAX endopeptidase family protein [Methanobrevibacter sp. YE315]
MNSNKKFFSKIGFNYLIYAISAMIIAIIIINVINGLNLIPLDDINVLSIISAICNYLLPLPIFLYLMKKLDSEKIEKSKIDFKTLLKYLCITFTLMWIGNIIGLLLTAGIGVLIQKSISNPIQNLIETTDIILNLLLISIIGPIFEEFIFRKLLIDRTIKYGVTTSILLSAVLFGLFHGNLNQFFYAALIGSFFAYVYIKTGKITYPIILHIIVNIMGSVVSLFLVNSANALTTNINPTDLTIILLYLIIMAITFLIGLIALIRYLETNHKNIKTEIPLKDIFLNAGMICFIAFFVIQMIIQLF